MTRALSRLLQRSFQINPPEMQIAVLSFAFIFILMSSYTILKPVRDAMPSDWGDVALAVKWTYTFIFSTIAVSLYGFVASRLSLRVLVPGVYLFFSLSFILFYLAYRGSIPVPYLDLGGAFYVWVSVFSVFHISVFWSFMTQNFSNEQGKRIFGFIATGASAGAIVGPTVVTFIISKEVKEETILLMTSTMLVLPVLLIFRLNHLFQRKSREEAGPDSAGAGMLSSNPFSGFQEFITHRRLLAIAGFVFLFTGISTSRLGRVMA